MLVGTIGNSRINTALDLDSGVVEPRGKPEALFPPLDHRHENEERGSGNDARESRAVSSRLLNQPGVMVDDP